jgi:tetratricopeptide (TPR) repeat protein
VEQDEIDLPILVAIGRVQARQAGANELLEACDEVRRDLDESRAEFERQILLEDETVRPALTPEIEHVYRSFEVYHRVIDSLAAYTQDFEAERLDDGLEYIPNCIARLTLDFQRYREAALAQRGPTTHPGLNLLCTLCGLCKTGQGQPEDLEEAVQKEMARAQDWLDQDLSSSQSGLELQAFYENYAQLLQECPDLDGLDGWVELLVQLGHEYARLDLDSLRRRFAYGPSQVPWVNLLVHTSWLMTQDSVSPALMRDLLYEAAAELEKASVGLSGWEESGGVTAEAGQLLSQLHEWITQLDEWLDNPQAETQAVLAQQGLQLAEQYPRLVESIEGQSQPGGGATCLVCGNPTSGSKCSRCGARVHASSTLNPDERPAQSRIERLLAQAEQILREVGDIAGFEASLEALRQDLRLARAKDPGPKVPAALAELRQRYLDSLESFEAALAEFDGFSESPSVEALHAAQEPLRQSVEDLLEVQKELQASVSRA